MRKMSLKRKKTLFGIYILGYISIFYLTFILLYLNKMDTNANYDIYKLIKNIYYAFTGTYTVKYFFENIFWNKDLIQIEFMPVSFKKIILKKVICYEIFVSMILSIFYLAKILSSQDSIFVSLVSFFSDLIIINALASILLLVIFVGIFTNKIKKLRLRLMERFFYISFIILFPSILSEKTKILIVISLLLNTMISFYLIRKEDRKYAQGMYYILYDEYSLQNSNYRIKASKKNKIYNKLSIYAFLEIKRYASIRRTIFSALIQFVVSVVVLILVFEKKGINNQYIYLLFNFFVADNFFATTAYSSDKQEIYDFYPINNKKIYIIKSCLAAFLQMIIFTITYIVLNLIFKYDIEYILTYVVMLILCVIYSFLGCALDIMFKRTDNETSGLIYGNIPKTVLVIISSVIFGIIIKII